MTDATAPRLLIDYDHICRLDGPTDFATFYIDWHIADVLITAGMTPDPQPVLIPGIAYTSPSPHITFIRAGRKNGRPGLENGSRGLQNTPQTIN